MTVLVTGGAGYIGSHALLSFLDKEITPVVLDNLSTGHRIAIPEHLPFYEGCISDTTLVSQIFKTHNIDTVLHFAGSTVVPESVQNPIRYFQNNTAHTLSFLHTALEHGLKHFIFSSTASVYGTQTEALVTENTPLNPQSPYAHSKAMIETMLKTIHQAHDLNVSILRYFNVAGADLKGRAGQRGHATHLIKVACEKALGKRTELAIFGNDYPTPDGTGVRDYIHVNDLVQVHLDVWHTMQRHPEPQYKVFNCGYGKGYSVKEVLTAVERVSQTALNPIQAPRRAGDPPALIADSNHLRTSVHWTPQYDDLDTIIRSALAFEKTLS